jgi:hypothetical protein
MSQPVISSVEATIPEGVTIGEWRRARTPRRSSRRGHVVLAAGAVLLGGLLALPQAAFASPVDVQKRAGDPFHIGGSPFPPSAQPAGAAGSAPAGGPTYGGSSSQGSPVVVRTARNRKRISRFLTVYSAPCSDGDTFFATSGALRAAVSGGRFTGRETGPIELGDGRADYDERVTGRISAARASGTWRAVIVGRDAAGNEVWRCDTGRVAWRAAASAYGGDTSQDEPFVIDPRAGSVRVATSWGAECADDAYFGTTDALGPFPLRAGRFSGTADDQFEQDGNRVLLSRTIAGRVGRKRASGTLRTQVAIVSASGRVLDTCDSGPLRWTALP